jgi:hypothetical protein
VGVHICLSWASWALAFSAFTYHLPFALCASTSYCLALDEQDSGFASCSFLSLPCWGILFSARKPVASTTGDSILGLSWTRGLVSASLLSYQKSNAKFKSTTLRVMQLAYWWHIFWWHFSPINSTWKEVRQLGGLCGSRSDQKKTAKAPRQTPSSL